jgi:phospholipid/cholesterol/gamma-HCH transport system ATP-binding protein
MIEIKDLTIGFDGNNVLENINFNIHKNNITIIVGQSGCGKSVLVKTIEGLYKPLNGKVIIDGYDIFSLKRKQLQQIRRKLTMLFQGSALLDSLNVYQNVSLPLFEHTEFSEKDIYDIVTEKLELVGLKDILYKMPSELSGGMKKRVALARAIILHPEYIIYDEPTTGLDPIIADEINKLILKLYKNFKIVPIIITHDFDCIKKIGEKIVMIHDKKIIFDGTLSDYKNSHDPRIKKFQGKY